MANKFFFILASSGSINKKNIWESTNAGYEKEFEIKIFPFYTLTFFYFSLK